MKTTDESLDPAEFDRFRNSYEHELDRVVSWAGQDADVYARVKAETLLDLAERHVGDPKELSFLDVGCGTGSTDQHLVGRADSLHGVDISTAMIERARSANPTVDYHAYDGSRLPFGDGAFDVAFAVCVVHHVPPSSWPSFVGELARVIRRGGIVAIVEHNPFNPITRAIVSRCAFDRDATLLSQRTTRRLLAGAGLSPVETRNILFVPWRGRLVQRLETTFRGVPAGAQYVTIGQRRP